MDNNKRTYASQELTIKNRRMYPIWQLGMFAVYVTKFINQKTSWRKKYEYCCSVQIYKQEKETDSRSLPNYTQRTFPDTVQRVQCLVPMYTVGQSDVPPVTRRKPWT